MMVKTVQKPKWFTSERHKEAVSHVEAVLYEYPEDKYSYAEFIKWLGDDNYKIDSREAPIPGQRWGRMVWYVKLKTVSGDFVDVNPGEYIVKLDSGKFIILQAETYKALFEDSGTQVKNDYVISWATGPTEETIDTDNRVELTRTDTSGAINWLSDKSESTEEKDYYSNIADF